eukprot:984684-Heterocapsa_arctica.AAC.1
MLLQVELLPARTCGTRDARHHMSSRITAHVLQGLLQRLCPAEVARGSVPAYGVTGLRHYLSEGRSRR